VKSRSAGDWDQFFDQHPEIWYQRVFDYNDVLNDPQALLNGYIVEKDIPHAGRHRVAGLPVRLSRTPGAPQPLFADLGQHTEEVMLELGYTRDEIEALQKETSEALAARYL
jgi:crotonobetainyl-CoA:carnitine CoA-transferase CaiB-like acyl-CoA transferase